MLYEKELKALKKAKRLRTRKVVDLDLKDFASNDYLGLAHNKTLHQLACNTLQNHKVQAPKASMLVNGYHQIHKDFEDALCEANGFEDAIVLGSGFNANIAMIEALTRKGDALFLDELYHASGVLASEIGAKNVTFFQHNNMQALRVALKNSTAKRKIIAVEGIYSMDGDMCDKEVFALAEEFENVVLIVDEAHSSGVVGRNLMGVFDFYNITPQKNHIKMGTLGKAYGSFGAYILASSHIVEYLLNRAKPIIYATSLSLYDTQRALESLRYIQTNTQQLRQSITRNQEIVFQTLGVEMAGLIAPLVIGDNNKVMQIQNDLYKKGYSVGAIRQPTVSQAIIRLIARVGEDTQDLKKVCHLLSEYRW
jgi:8-amino-7-oxononanoate synthase